MFRVIRTRLALGKPPATTSAAASATFPAAAADGAPARTFAYAYAYAALAVCVPVALLLTLGNGVAGGELGELIDAAVALVLIAGLALVARAGHPLRALVLLAVLLTLATVASFLTPLPSGSIAWTWSYAPGLFVPLLALVPLALAAPARVSLPVALLCLATLVALVVLMPHAPSLAALEREAGIPADGFYPVLDSLLRPVVLSLALIGMAVMSRALGGGSAGARGSTL